MNQLVQFNEVRLVSTVVDSQNTEWSTEPDGPVWINPLGVNLVARTPDAPATSIRLDDGLVIFVSEYPEVVVTAINKELAA